MCFSRRFYYTLLYLKSHSNLKKHNLTNYIYAYKYCGAGYIFGRLRAFEIVIILNRFQLRCTNSAQEYLRIYGRLLVNSFALRVDNRGEEENVGTGNNIIKKQQHNSIHIRQINSHAINNSTTGYTRGHSIPNTPQPYCIHKRQQYPKK